MAIDRAQACKMMKKWRSKHTATGRPSETAVRCLYASTHTPSFQKHTWMDLVPLLNHEDQGFHHQFTNIRGR